MLGAIEFGVHKRLRKSKLAVQAKSSRRVCNSCYRQHTHTGLELFMLTGSNVSQKCFLNNLRAGWYQWRSTSAVGQKAADDSTIM